MLFELAVRERGRLPSPLCYFFIPETANECLRMWENDFLRSYWWTHSSFYASWTLKPQTRSHSGDNNRFHHNSFIGIFFLLCVYNCTNMKRYIWSEGECIKLERNRNLYISKDKQYFHTQSYEHILHTVIYNWFVKMSGKSWCVCVRVC